METAKTILAQLGGNRFIVMTGAKGFCGDSEKLMFSLPSNFAKSGINKIVVKLTPMDDYTVEFWKIRGTKCNKIETVEGVYNDNLRAVFTARTGLDCTL